MKVVKKAKPTATKSEAAKPAKAPAKKVKAAKAPKFKYAIGAVVAFVGYGEGVAKEDRVFNAGERLVVKEQSFDDESKTNVYGVVREADSAAFDKDSESVEGGEVTEAEIGKAPKVKEAPAPVVIEVREVGDLKKLIKKGDILETAKATFEDAKKQFFYFGGLLAKIYHENLYSPKDLNWQGSKEGRDAWEHFVENNFGLKGAVARGYIDIYMSISALPKFDLNRLGAIGWSKAAEISKYITEENADELLELAEDKPITELKEELKTNYVDADGKTPSGRTTRSSGDKIKMTDFNFRLFEDQATSVSFIMEEAKKKFGHENMAETFEAIVTEWASDHLDASKVKKASSAKNAVQKDLKKRGIALPSKKKETVAA